jgi:transketolase
MKYSLEISEKSQCETACEAMIDLAERDPRVVVLTADLKYSSKTLEFSKKYPDRFFEMGIAEQNMISFAAGMALSGLIPFVSTFVTFAILRSCEQIRTDLAHAKTNVKIIPTHAGVTSGVGGPTHHGNEDLGVARTIPDLTIIVPAGPIEAYKATIAAAKMDGPIYIRLGRNPEPLVYTDDYEFSIGKALTLRDGTDATIIAIGRMVAQALMAADELAESGIQARVVNMHTLKPLDEEMILNVATESPAIITVEEHNIIGGLGSAVAEVLAETTSAKVLFRRLGIPDVYCKIGNETELTRSYGLDGPSIALAVRELLEKAR